MNLSPMTWKTGLPPQRLPAPVTMPARAPATLADLGYSRGGHDFIPSWSFNILRPVHPDTLNPFVLSPPTGNLDQIVITGRPRTDNLPISSRIYQSFIAPWWERDDGSTPADSVAGVFGDDDDSEGPTASSVMEQSPAQRRQQSIATAAAVLGAGLLIYALMKARG